MGALLPRVVLALAAVVLIAWFGVLARNHWLGEGASARIIDDPGMGQAEWGRAMEDLREAEWLDPGTEWQISRANYLLLRDTQAALRQAEAVLRLEPDNLNAWFIVRKATDERDPERSARAQQEIRRLNPRPASNR